MRGDEQMQDPGGPWVPLSTTELRARRAAQRRRRRQHRVAFLTGLIVLVAVAAIALARGHGRGAPNKVAGQAGTVGGQHRHDARARAHASRLMRAQAAEAARETNRVLAYTSYVRLLPHRSRDVALTFDDGPSPYTHQILRTLKRMHAKATFFAIGYAARGYPSLVSEEARDGFEVGDHTETHAYLQHISRADQVREIEDQMEAVRRAGAPNPVLFRPPYGSFNATTLSILHSQKLLMVLWSVDTSDYARPGVDAIVKSAVSSAAPGAIILMHDGGGDRSETVAALPRIIRGLRRRGFHLVTVSQLLAADPPRHGQPAPTPLSGLG